MRLILGSSSPRRLELLAQIGVVPDGVQGAEIDETPLKNEDPRTYVTRMAREKALAILPLLDTPSPRAGEGGPVAETLANGRGGGGAEVPLILTADTTVSTARRILGKPEDEAQAAGFLRLLSGRRHRVTTAICLAQGARLWQRRTETQVRFKRLSEAEITAYLGSGEWQGKAGGYAIQGLAGAYIPAINGSYSNVVGLPLAETAGLLQGAGYMVP